MRAGSESYPAESEADRPESDSDPSRSDSDGVRTVNIGVLVGPTELFGGEKSRGNPFLGPPLLVSIPPTTFDNISRPAISCRLHGKIITEIAKVVEIAVLLPAPLVQV